MNNKNYFLYLTFIFCLLSFVFVAQATIRYVSHTGSSTPPYTTWETAADSIQKCIDYSVANDTIIVANGTYFESLIINKYLWLWGSSMDSTIIDGTGLATRTIIFQADGYIKCFTIKGKGQGTNFTTCIQATLANLTMISCKIINAQRGIGLVWSSSIIDGCIITNVEEGYLTGCDIDTCNPEIKNSVIVLNNSNNSAYGGITIDGSKNISMNNILIGNSNSLRGIRAGVFFDPSINIIKNSAVSGFEQNIDGYATDTAIVQNNTSSYGSQRGITINSKTDMRNNIITHNGTGVVGPTNTNSDYNLYWNNNTNTSGGLAEHDIVADPMFVNDTIPVYDGDYDYHLQKYSPAIDTGDPNIPDVDGTRSDIGAYGGPGGETYTYLDLPPKPPVNLNVNVDSLVTLTWNRNSEADTAYYNVYRDTVANFTIDSTKLIGSPTDTFYTEPIPKGQNKIFYKVTCVDMEGNESEPSEEAVIILTVGLDEPKVINNYALYQNYPNPFNPSTKIGYKLIERGYVKLMVYDITGSLVSVLVNEVEEAGYYEVEFTAQTGGGRTENGTGNLASGIYLYRIEVIGDGNIPRFSDMRKMILIK